MKSDSIRHGVEYYQLIKFNIMKKLLFFAALIVPLCTASGQRSIDRLFDKYSGADGFTTVTIGGSLLNFATSIENDNDEKSIKARITEVRILAQDDKAIRVVNFLDFIGRDIDLNDYEEFMRVKESHQDLRMLVRSQGRKITEFLLVAGGDDNAIIQIKGNMTFSDAKKLSEEAKKSNDLNIFADPR